MSIAIEGYTVVVLRSRSERSYEGGLEALQHSSPNSTGFMDDDLWRCSFMTMAEAQRFLAQIAAAGMKVDGGPDPDAVIVSEFEEPDAPHCEWLQMGKWDKGVIAWKVGSDPKKLVARKGWTPEKGSGLEFGKMEDLEFLRREGSVEVYRNRKTGKEVYVGRSEADPEPVFQAASKVINENAVEHGQKPLQGPAERDVQQALEDLEGIVKDGQASWAVHWHIGRGRQAVGDLQAAYLAFQRAWELEQGNEIIPRSLAGICLELGKAEEAVRIGEKAAALQPDSPDTLGNLACAYLLAGRLNAATKTVDSALRLAPADSVNRAIQKIIEGVQSGTIPRPTRLADLTQPTRKRTPRRERKKKSFWSRFGF